jgi:formylglycine-generating enzyme required for sulfatase activity
VQSIYSKRRAVEAESLPFSAFPGIRLHILRIFGTVPTPDAGCRYLRPMPPARQPLTLATLPGHIVWVEGGVFEMGSEEYDNEKPIHPVRLDGFYLCRYPVTQALWEAVMGTNPSQFPHPQRPVESVSWYDCVEFCNALSERQGYQPAYYIDRERKDPNNQNDADDLKWLVTPISSTDGYRLPTEAEWEYAARGGRYAQPFEYAGSPNLNEAAWWNRNSQGFSQPVGLKAPNSLGLFDINGNVWEWVWDWHDNKYYHQIAQQPGPAPVGPDSGSGRGVRGGSWGYDGYYLHVAYRLPIVPLNRSYAIGLRLCRYLAR